MSSASTNKRFRPKVAAANRQRTAQACVACRKRKRKCWQRSDGACEQCRESGKTCVIEPVASGSGTSPSGVVRRDVSLRAQRQIEAEMSRLHPGLEVSFEMIESAARVMEKFKGAEGRDNSGSPVDPRRLGRDTNVMGDFQKTVLEVVGRPIDSPATSQSLDDLDDHGEIVREIICGLPPWDVAEPLIEALFHYGESNWYYCDQARFRRRLMSLYNYGVGSDEASPGFLSFVLMAMALGSHFQHLPSTAISPENSFDNSRLLGRQYYEAAQKLHTALMQNITLEGVQTTLLMALFLLPTGRHTSNYTLTGLSLRMATALSLHKLAADGDAQAEERRRVFWTVWCLERRFSHVLGAPDMLWEGDITTPLPVYDAALDAGNPNKQARLSAFIELTKLQSLAARKSSKSIMSLEDVRGLEHRLQSWLEKLPDSLRSYDSHNMRATVHLQLMYHITWLDVGRRPLLSLVKAAIHSQPGFSDASAKHQQVRQLARLCASSAHTILRLIQTLRQTQMLASFSHTDFHACSSAIVVVLLDAILHPRPGVTDTIVAGVDTLEMLAKSNDYAQRGFNLVRRFCTTLSSVMPELAALEAKLSRDRAQYALHDTTCPETTDAWSQQPVMFTSNFDDMMSWPCIDQSTNHHSDARSSYPDHHHTYETADFEALESIMAAESDLWNIDQTEQDLYFFGLGGVGSGF